MCDPYYHGMFQHVYAFLCDFVFNKKMILYPSWYQASFGLPVDVDIKSGLHIDVNWTYKRRLMPTVTIAIVYPK